MKTKIKQANWKSKPFFGKKDKEYMNIVTTVYWQGDDVFIDTDSKFLFQIVCENFFRQHKKAKLKIILEKGIGYMFPEAYRLYVYNLIYKELTGKKIKNDILEVEDSKELYYRTKLDAQLPKHQKRILKIIKILEIDFEKESDMASHVLFNMEKKKEFYLSDKTLFKK